MIERRKAEPKWRKWMPVIQYLTFLVMLGVFWGRSETLVARHTVDIQRLNIDKLDASVFVSYKTGRESTIDVQLYDIKTIQSEIRSDIKTLLRSK